MKTNQAPRSYHVFFSHGGEDTYMVSEFFCPKVLASGAEVFVDEGEISYGDDFREKIFQKLSISDELILLLTPSSIHRPWIFVELGAAILKGIHIVAIRYGVSEEELRKLGILSILGTRKLLIPSECDKYVSQLRSRVSEKING